MNLEIHELSTSEIASAVRSRTVSAAEVTNAILERIDVLNPRINALVLVTPEAALDAARRIDERIASGEDPGTVGDGSGMEQGRYLKPGDTIELDVPGLGTLRQTMGPKQTVRWMPEPRKL